MTSQNEEEQPTNLFSDFEKLQSETNGISAIFGKKANLSSAGLVSNAILQEIYQNQKKFKEEVMDTLKMMQDAIFEGCEDMKQEMIGLKGKQDEKQREMMEIKEDGAENCKNLIKMTEIQKNEFQSIRNEISKVREEMRQESIQIKKEVAENASKLTGVTQKMESSKLDVITNQKRIEEHLQHGSIQIRVDTENLRDITKEIKNEMKNLKDGTHKMPVDSQVKAQKSEKPPESAPVPTTPSEPVTSNVPTKLDLCEPWMLPNRIRRVRFIQKPREPTSSSPTTPSETVTSQLHPKAGLSKYSKSPGWTCSDDSTIKFTVIPFTNEPFELRMRPVSTIKYVKEQIAFREEYFGKFYLSYKEKPLFETTKTLHELGIVNHSVIQMKHYGQSPKSGNPPVTSHTISTSNVLQRVLIVFSVITSINGSFKLGMKHSSTIKQVKNLIALKERCSADDFYLTYNDKPLDNTEKTLQELGIIDGSIIQMKLHGQH